jgi:hypothetical protein
MAVDKSCGEGDTAPLDATPEEKRLYRMFCRDVEVAAGPEKSWHPKTKARMRTLWSTDQQQWTVFWKCLAIARETAGDSVAYRWKEYLKEARRGYKADTASATTADVSRLSRREAAEAVQLSLQALTRVSTKDWLAKFCYRRMAATLARQCDRYCERYEEERQGEDALYREAIKKSDKSAVLHALFREMCPKRRAKLPVGYTDTDIARYKYGPERATLKQAEQNGQRWKLLADTLGTGALLLIGPDVSSYLQRSITLPIFTAWVRLVQSTVLGIEGIAETALFYHDYIARDPSVQLQLRKLKLEDPAYDACPAIERFEVAPESEFDQALDATEDSSGPIRPVDGVIEDSRVGRYTMLEALGEEGGADEGVMDESVTDEDLLGLADSIVQAS